MTISIFLFFIFFPIVSFLYILGTSNAFWWNEFPILQTKERNKEVYWRSLGFALMGLFPIGGVVVSVIIFLLADWNKHGFKLTRY